MRERRPDLVLLDLHLPDVSGEEILDELAADAEHGAIPVVIVSAAASKGRVQRLRERGARAYLTKPIDLAELYEVVHTVLGERTRPTARSTAQLTQLGDIAPPRPCEPCVMPDATRASK